VGDVQARTVPTAVAPSVTAYQWWIIIIGYDNKLIWRMKIHTKELLVYTGIHHLG
jgi:hypothetical protein